MSSKRKIIISVIGVLISITFLAISSILAEEEIITPAIAIILTAASAVLVMIAILFAAKVDYETGVYKCRKCGHIFKPTSKANIFSVHTLTTRHLKCPKCEEKSWCKRKSTAIIK